MKTILFINVIPLVLGNGSLEDNPKYLRKNNGGTVFNNGKASTIIKFIEEEDQFWQRELENSNSLSYHYGHHDNGSNDYDLDYGSYDYGSYKYGSYSYGKILHCNCLLEKYFTSHLKID